MSEQMPSFALDEFQGELGEASAALQAFAQGPAQRAADEVGESFERAGERIARALGAAASGGEASFKRLAKVVLEELAKIALQQLFSGSGGSAPFFGAKAAGGAVKMVPTDNGSRATELTNFHVAQLEPAMPGSLGNPL